MNDYIPREKIIKMVEKAADGYEYLETNAEAFISDIKAIPPAFVIDRREYNAVVAENRFLKAMQQHLIEGMDLTELGKMVATSLAERSGT